MWITAEKSHILWISRPQDIVGYTCKYRGACGIISLRKEKASSVCGTRRNNCELDFTRVTHTS